MRIILKPAAQPAPITAATEAQSTPPVQSASSQPQQPTTHTGPLISVVESTEPKLNYFSSAAESSTPSSREAEKKSGESEKSEAIYDKPEKSSDIPATNNSKRLRGSPPLQSAEEKTEKTKPSEKLPASQTDPAAAALAEITLLTELKKKGFVIKPMKPDGNCLFRSVAHQVYGDPEMHDIVRKNCMDYIEHEKEHFSQFVTEDVNDYIARKRRLNVYGNNLEIQACAEIYNRPIEVFSGVSGDKPLNIFQDQYKTENFPIRLSYHNGNHYNSVLDPNNPSVGVGLGLPNLQPGLADKTLMAEAIKVSEETAIENILVNTLQKETEIQQTEKEIEDAILQASLRESRAQAQPRVLRRSDDELDVDIEQAIAASLADFTAQQKHQKK